MTDPQRIDRLTEPAVVGRVYLVPTIRAIWPNGIKEHDWPVIGPKHADIEFLNYEWDHYHVDARFVSREMDRYAHRSTKYKWFYFQTPISSFARPRLPDVVWQPRWMYREMPAYPGPFREESGIVQIAAAFAGHQCERGKGGWICPHRKASLGSLTPVNGVITCPLHGLRIDAERGRVLNQE